MFNLILHKTFEVSIVASNDDFNGKRPFTLCKFLAWQFSYASSTTFSSSGKTSFWMLEHMMPFFSVPWASLFLKTNCPEKTFFQPNTTLSQIQSSTCQANEEAYAILLFSSVMSYFCYKIIVHFSEISWESIFVLKQSVQDLNFFSLPTTFKTIEQIVSDDLFGLVDGGQNKTWIASTFLLK